jgi:RND family efflux transporter MFP subunit
MKPAYFLILAAAGVSALQAQPVETVKVAEQRVERKTRLPGELLPFLKVTLQARVSGFVESVAVDRGSAVKAGDTLVRLSAPELAAQIAEAEAKVVEAESKRAEAQARLAAAESTLQRLKEASATPGVVAANEIVVAEKETEAIRALINSLDTAAVAARAAVKPLREMQSYLEAKAPFDGVVTERRIHPGALAGPAAGNPALLEIEQVSRLRLVVAVPEVDTGAISRNGAVTFKVPAYPGRTFRGTVARISRSLDAGTRSMPVEVDVNNASGALAPGMYAEVEWPVRRTAASLLVPPEAVVTTTERTFVVRVSGGKAEWVNVSKGALAGELVEVMGALRAGDEIVKRATDEIREGSALTVAQR